MGDVEIKIEETDATRLEEDRQKWIIDMKRQREHFKLLKIQMVKLKRDPDANVAEEIWKNHIEPNLDK